MRQRFMGIDVAKATLMTWLDGSAVEIKNCKADIRRLLKSLDKEVVLGIETTSTYHLLMAQTACEMGFTVYLLNPRDCARYRQALFGRGKTDQIDAHYIARFLEKEHEMLRVFEPLPENLQSLRNLIRRRETTIEALVKLELSFGGDPKLKRHAKTLFADFRKLIELLDRQIKDIIGQFEQSKALLKIPGVGPVNAAVAISVLATGSVKSADSYIAYIGLDPRPKDSGPRVGKRALSKRGDRLLRKYIFLAAMSAAKSPLWRDYYGKQTEKGLKFTQAAIALARKIARTMWSIYTYNTTFNPNRISNQKLQTATSDT